MSTPRMMVIGAHISDAENMAGALMLKHKRAGWGITIVHMTAGEKGHPTLPPDEYIAMRRADAEASAAFLGADFELLPYRDAELEVTDDAIQTVVDVIRKHRPQALLTHWKGSFHPDHNHTFEIVRRALFLADLPSFRSEHAPHSVETFLCAENWEDMADYSPDIYVDVSEVFGDYLRLLKTHALMREGYASFRYYDYYEALGTVRGALAGFDKAVTLMRPPDLYRFEREPGLLLK